MRKLLTALILVLLYQPVFAEINNVPEGDVLGKNNMSFCAMGASDGGNYDSLQLDASKYLMVNVASGGFVGSTTPTDAFANPTDAVKSFSLNAGYNGTGFDILRTAYTDGLATTGILAVGLMGWNGTTMDRVDIDANDAIYVNPGATSHDNDNMAILPDNSVATANTTTATSTIVNAAAGDLLKVIVGVGVASSTFKVYNDASGSCDTNLIGTFDSATSGVVYNFGIPLSTGICILTSGATDLTVVYRDNP